MKQVKVTVKVGVKVEISENLVREFEKQPYLRLLFAARIFYRLMQQTIEATARVFTIKSTDGQMKDMF